LTIYQDTLTETLAAMPDDWPARFTASRRLAEATPALTAHSLRHCSDTTRAAVETVAGRLGATAPERMLLQLPLDAMLAAWHWAQREWSESGAGDDLSARVRRAFAAFPGSLDLTVGE
jgi:hypothetical protein